MEVFSISPASSRPLWFITFIGVLLTLILAILVYTAYSSQHSRVEIESNHLRLVGDLWGRTISRELLDSSQARIIDLYPGSDYSLKHRTLGTGLPGYASGWFRLQNGEKALVYLTRRDRVVYIPTFLDYSLLLSVENPERFIRTLQQ